MRIENRKRIENVCHAAMFMHIVRNVHWDRAVAGARAVAVAATEPEAIGKLDAPTLLSLFLFIFIAFQSIPQRKSNEMNMSA